MTESETNLMGLMNLHDAFLNTTIQHSLMHQAPLERDPELFHISDRARLERTWVMFLYVLVEAWRSPAMAPVRSWVSTILNTSDLDRLLTDAAADGYLNRMYEGRSYMCHRDRREYWDDGWMAVCGELSRNEVIHSEFGRVLLVALKAFEGQARTRLTP